MAEGTITPDEYMEKLERFVTLRTNGVKQTNNAYMLRPYLTLRLSFIKSSRNMPVKVLAHSRAGYGLASV